MNIAGTAALLELLRRRLGGMELARTARAFVLITIASTVLAGVSYGLWRLLDEAFGRSLGAQIVSLGAALVAGFGAYAISCRLLGVRELEALLSLRSRRRSD